jgi:hypothetical protein
MHLGLYLVLATLLAEPSPLPEIVHEGPTAGAILMDILIIGVALATAAIAGFLLFRKPRHTRTPGVKQS